jgi:lysozyme
MRRTIATALFADGLCNAFSAALLAAAVTACSSDGQQTKDCAASSNEALTVCSTGPTLKGVDVSSYQGSVDWAQVNAAGTSFAIMRVSDGAGHPDSQFAKNWSGAKGHHIVRGAYQFFRPGEDPVAQANLFATMLEDNGGIGPGDLPPVLDYETADGQPAATVIERAKLWLATMELKTGKKPIVYTASFMSSYTGNNFSDYPLWVANYGASCPLMPTGWSKWIMWQSADNGSVSGITGGVDVDTFQGSMTDLLTLAAAGTPHQGGGGPRQPPAGPLPAGAGAVLGSSNPAPVQPPASSDPCAK